MHDLAHIKSMNNPDRRVKSDPAEMYRELANFALRWPKLSICWSAVQRTTYSCAAPARSWTKPSSLPLLTQIEEK